MITTALTAFLVSVIVFVLLVVVTQLERRRGRRFVGAKFRSWLDGVMARLEIRLTRSCSHFMKYMVQLNWYYSIHSVLRTILKSLVAVYTFFEVVFERNRRRTKELRAEKRQLHEQNHLKHMVAHKVDTALTPTEKQKLRKKKLEGRD